MLRTEPLGYENIDEKIDFLIMDCPASSMKWMVEQEMKNMNIGIPVGYMTWWGRYGDAIFSGERYI